MNTDATAREYVEKRFPRATEAEREKIIRDWQEKEESSDGIADDFERRARHIPNLFILDMGSGNGDIGIAFEKRGARVEGIDIEEDLVAIATAKASAQNSRAHFTLYDGYTVPFSDAIFDAVLSVSVIEHVSDPYRYFAEILRVLKPDGLLYLAFPNRLWPKETHTGLWGLSYLPHFLARIYVRLMGHNPLEDNNLHFYTYWNIRHFLNAAHTTDRHFTIRKESGATHRGIKNIIKRILSSFGIPHQALLPHVMLVAESSHL